MDESLALYSKIKNSLAHSSRVKEMEPPAAAAAAAGGFCGGVGIRKLQTALRL